MPETPKLPVEAEDHSGSPHRGGRTARRVTALALVLVAIGVGTYLLVQPGAGATSAGNAGPAAAGLAFLTCRPLASDPPLEAPEYALDEGARGGNDSWWCQLPHATQVPVGYGPASRYVAPLPNDYADYSTEYTKGGSTGATDPASNLVVTADVNSAVTPGVTVHKAPKGGQQVKLTNGVTADVVVSGKSVSVGWSYPTTGVPSYLQGVSSMSVVGTNLPPATVVAVAGHVEPD
jgi:hypothetical protein